MDQVQSFPLEKPVLERALLRSDGDPNEPVHGQLPLEGIEALVTEVVGQDLVGEALLVMDLERISRMGKRDDIVLPRLLAILEEPVQL